MQKDAPDVYMYIFACLYNEDVNIHIQESSI